MRATSSEDIMPPLMTAAEFEAEVAPQLAQPPPRTARPPSIVRAELVTLEDLKMEPIDWFGMDGSREARSI